LKTRGVRTKDPCVMNDGLERSGGVGLFGKGAGFFDAGEITHQYRAPPGTARIASCARCVLRPCKTTSWPEVTRRCAASRPRPSAEPVMKTLATITPLLTPRPVSVLLATPA